MFPESLHKALAPVHAGQQYFTFQAVTYSRHLTDVSVISAPHSDCHACLTVPSSCCCNSSSAIVVHQ